MAVINLLVLAKFAYHGNYLHGVGYFIFFYASIYGIDYFTDRIKPKTTISIKKPKQELFVILIFIALGVLFMALKFLFDQQASTNNALRLTILIGSLLFGLPLAALIYLLFRKYKFSNLGFSCRPVALIFIGVFVWALTGLIAYLFNKNGIIWKEGYAELGGVLGIILQGIIGAALVEEFTRFILQTRIQEILKIKHIGILLATIIWAFMHFPMSFFKTDHWLNSTMYCIQIIPIGYVWGYLSFKTKSIVPSVFAHGLNLWGLQNG